MDPAKYNGQMQNIAYGEAFMAAAEDYKKVGGPFCQLAFESTTTTRE